MEIYGFNDGPILIYEHTKCRVGLTKKMNEIKNVIEHLKAGIL